MSNINGILIQGISTEDLSEMIEDAVRKVVKHNNNVEEQEKKTLTRDEICERLNITRAQFYRNKHSLASYGMYQIGPKSSSWRMDSDDLERYLASRKKITVETR